PKRPTGRRAREGGPVRGACRKGRSQRRTVIPDPAKATARSTRSRASALPPAPCVSTRPSGDGEDGRWRNPRTAGRPAAVAVKGSPTTARLGPSRARKRLDRLLLLEARDLVRRVAQLAKDLIGMLTVRRRRLADRARSARQRRRHALDADLAALGMAHRLGHAEMLDLRIVEHLLDVVDRAGGHAGLVEGLDPLGARPLDQHLVELLVHRLPVLRAVAHRLEARIADQMLGADRLAQP